VCLFVVVVDAQNQQTSMFTEDRQMLAAGAVISTETTLCGIEESDVERRCLPRLSRPFHVSMNLDSQADENQKNKRCQLHGPHSTRQTAGCTQTSDTSASLSMPQSHGYNLACCSPIVLCRRTFPLAYQNFAAHRSVTTCFWQSQTTSAAAARGALIWNSISAWHNVVLIESPSSCRRLLIVLVFQQSKIAPNIILTTLRFSMLWHSSKSRDSICSLDRSKKNSD